MAISYTYHGGVRGRDASGQHADALQKPEGARVDVADAGVSSALTVRGWYRIVASTTSYVAIGPSVTNGTNGAHFPEGHVEVWWLEAGVKIGCSAGV